jgi:FG-GAP repeat
VRKPNFPAQKAGLVLRRMFLVLTAVYGMSSNGSASPRNNGLTRQAEAWVQLPELIDGPNIYADVAISDNTLVVGDYSANSYEGVAFLFVKAKSGWVYAGELTASNGGGEFGRAVAISGGTIVVGALWCR